ncbi:M20/M25/M40 family metallo-hydrolase [uncultured Paraglaciecola sp.]|uniref:M20/M25/M40 family metallo-hydrolase n=1 Tax=uncultured Paraglaciecola sp. TaxID=1765024 RepID=UPI0026046495|nr:M20/M25/M40 family metallo-hydrolase [uncultured Paraglaciecola sp.]
MKKTVLMILCISTSMAWANSDLDMANKIRSEGFYNSEVMHTLEQLTDEIGPRLSGSPQMKQANDWTLNKLKSWGLKNAYLDPFEFGRGWSHDAASIHLVSPREVTLHGIPVAWTPGTNGDVSGDVVIFEASSVADLAKYKGKLSGKIIMMGVGKNIEAPKNSVFKRYDAGELTKLKEFDVKSKPSHAPWVNDSNRDSALQRYNFGKKLSEFLAKEKVAAVLYRSWRQGGLINIFGRDHRVGNTFPVPALVLEAEHYNSLSRMIDNGKTPKIRLDIKARFHDDDRNAYNTIAEISGSDDDPEIVMVGGHLDSWHASDGAVDNGAGVAVAMEAVRILSTLDFKPKRTIRIALWSGEEQGLFGSRAYVDKHFATRPKPKNKDERSLPSYLWKSQGWPIKTKPAYEKLSVYFNMDNGSGRFRGIYTEGNVAVKPIFSKWFTPYADLSTGTITNKSTGGTDHEAFDNVGLPGFQFIQDKLDYGSRLHHTHIDSIDHVVEADLIQASVIMAGFIYQASMADERMPRKPIPQDISELQKQKMQLNIEKERIKREKEANKAKAINALQDKI